MHNDNLLKTYNRLDITFKKGKGTKLWDEKGNEYLDFVSGVAVNCLGHCHPIILDALKKQSENLIHISNLYYNKPQNDLANKLCSIGDMKKVFFCNSGTESIETALKIARKYGTTFHESKKEIIYMNNSFHGRSMGALSVTGQPKYQNNFTPLVGGMHKAEINNINSIKNTINSNTCAVIIEPIQGEGGIISCSNKFLKELKTLCNKYNALLIFDEVQCGAGRLGSFFAYKQFDIVPDIVCMAKGLGGGFPIGATLTNEKVGKCISPGDHGSTFGGNPLACAVSLAIIKELLDKDIIKEISFKEKYLKSKIKALKDKYPCLLDISGKGLLIGIKFKDPKTIIKKCFNKRLLLVGAGENVIRLLPPLNVSYKEIDHAINILKEVLEEI